VTGGDGPARLGVPHRRTLRYRSVEKEDAFRRGKKAKSASEQEVPQLETEWKNTVRDFREALAKAESIETAVFDLKAVNPNRTNNGSSDARRAL
jgi:hypothetical protein